MTQHKPKRKIKIFLLYLPLGILALILAAAGGIYLSFVIDKSATLKTLARYKQISNKDSILNIRYNENTGVIKDFSTSRGFPMGGLGTGGFSMFTDGGLGKFRTNHNWFQSFGRAEFPKGSFFALRVQQGKDITSRILRRSYRDGNEFTNIRPVGHTAFKGRIPYFELDYGDDNLPVKIRLEGFTPLIPHNAKDSSLPAALFQFKITNPTDQELNATILASFENILGIGGSGGSALFYPYNGNIRYNDISGNYARRLLGQKVDGMRGLVFKTRLDYDKGDPRRRVQGKYLFLTDAQSLTEGSFSACPDYNARASQPSLIQNFHNRGHISTSCTPGQGNSGAFTVGARLAPGSSKKINIYLIWWTPHHVIEKNERLKSLTNSHGGIDYGHYYLNHFSQAEQLATYLKDNRERLARESRRIPDLVDRSNLPYWLKTYILNSTDSVLTNSVLIKDGSLYTIEGMPWGWPFGALTGTVDQRLASHVYMYSFFPQLDLSEIMSFVELSRNGRVPHGNGHADIALGTNDIPYGDAIKAFNKTTKWIDLPQSTIMQLGKRILQRGNLDLLRQSWPEMTRMMTFLESAMEEGFVEGTTTYDYMHYKPGFIYSAVMQSATFKMMIHLGQILEKNTPSPQKKQNIAKLIKKYKSSRSRIERTYNKKLWSERGYYRTALNRDSVFTSALAGDWITRYSGIGATVPPKRAKRHSQSQARALVESYPYMQTRIGKTRPLVYREATLKGKELPAINNGFRLYYVNNPWQSIAYQGLEAIYLGRTEAGLKLIKRIWDKGWHEGYPWDMDHWGMRGNVYMSAFALWLWDNDHTSHRGHLYMSHPSMWAIFQAITGIHYLAFEQTLTFAPRKLRSKERLEIPVFFPDFWLWLDYNFATGQAKITVLEVFAQGHEIAKIRLDQKEGEHKLLRLPNTFSIEKGNSFGFDLR